MARLAGILAALILMVLPFAVAHSQIFFGGLAVHGTAPEAAVAVQPIFRVEFEGGTSDCTDAGHCTDTTGCADADTTPTTAIDCNGTASASPSGGAYAEFDVAGADVIDFLDKFSEPEIWVKLYAYIDASAVAVGPSMFTPFEAGVTAIACGNTSINLDNLSTRSIFSRMCGTNATSPADPDYADATWQEYKFHFNVNTGVMSIWYPGEDFTGAPTTTADGVEEASPDWIDGFRLTNDPDFDTAYRIDDIRVYDQDPDRPVGSTLFTMNFEGGTDDCTDGGHCSDSTCFNLDSADLACNSTADPSPAGGAYAEWAGTGTTTSVEVRDKFSTHDLWMKYWWYADNGASGPFQWIFRPLEGVAATPGCSTTDIVWRSGTGASDLMQLRSCTVTQDGVHPDYLDQTWQQWKYNFNAKTGISQLWLPGSDFTALCGSTDCIEADGSASAEATPDFLEGLATRDDADYDLQRFDGIEVYDHNPDRALTDPIWTMDFEGGSSDCTTAAHCSGQTCAASDQATVDCNATADPSPAGGAYAEFDGSANGNVDFTDQFSEHEFWIKFYWWFDNLDVTHEYLNFLEAGLGAVGCGSMRNDALSTEAFRIRACGTLDTSSASAITLDTWGEVKLHVNINTGITEFWFPDSDFSGTPDLTADGSGSAEAEPDPITSFRLRNTNDSSQAYRVDSIRIYDRDPD